MSKDQNSPPRTRTHYAVNNGFAQFLAESQAINEAALLHKDQLASHGLGEAIFEAQKTKIAQALQKLQEARSQRTDSKGDTSAKSETRLHLETLLGQVQSSALVRDTLEGTDKAPKYYVGSDIGNANNEQFAVIGEGVITQLSHDDLPGISPEMEQQIEALFEKWQADIQTQKAAKLDAEGTQDSLEADIEAIKRIKQATQLAADAVYPYQKSENKTTREAFEIPTDRPYRPRRAKK